MQHERFIDINPQKYTLFVSIRVSKKGALLCPLFKLTP